MMLLKKKTIIGLFLCTLVFSSSVPLLMGIQASPEEVFGGDVITLSQVNSSVVLNASLAEELTDENNTDLASAEIYAFSVIKDQPVIVRGVNLDDFLAIENAEIIDGNGNISELYGFTVVGKSLSKRADLEVGDKFVLTGSSNPAVYQLEVDAIYDGEMGSDDLLIPLSRARKIAGLGKDSVSVIRVKTTNQTALVENLESKDQPVIISNPTGPSTVVNTNISDEERQQQSLAIKYLDTSKFKTSNGSYVSLFVQEGESSIKVVIVTFLFLDGALIFIGAMAILARAIIERRSDIGILSALGADRKYIRFQIIKDILVISIPASFLGVIGGYFIVKFVESSGLLLMFGQTVTPLLSTNILVGIFVATVTICIVSGIIINEAIMRATPQKMIQDSDKVGEENNVRSLIAILEVEP